MIRLDLSSDPEFNEMKLRFLVIVKSNEINDLNRQVQQKFGLYSACELGQKENQMPTLILNCSQANLDNIKSALKSMMNSMLIEKYPVTVESLNLSSYLDTSIKEEIRRIENETKCLINPIVGNADPDLFYEQRAQQTDSISIGPQDGKLINENGKIYFTNAHVTSKRCELEVADKEDFDSFNDTHHLVVEKEYINDFHPIIVCSVGDFMQKCKSTGSRRVALVLYPAQYMDDEKIISAVLDSVIRNLNDGLLTSFDKITFISIQTDLISKQLINIMNQMKLVTVLICFFLIFFCYLFSKLAWRWMISL